MIAKCLESIKIENNMNSQPESNSVQSVGAVSESRTLTSPMSPEDFLQVLDSSMIKSKKSLAMGGVHNIGGRIDQNNFILRKLAKFKNGFARDMYGTVVASDHGTHIVYRFELHMVVRIMFTLWFGLVTLLLLVGIASLFSGTPRLDIILGPLLMLAGGIGVVSFAISKGRNEEKELENFLYQIANSNMIGFPDSEGTR